MFTPHAAGFHGAEKTNPHVICYRILTQKTSHWFQIVCRVDILRSLCVLRPTYPKLHLKRYSSTLCTVIYYPVCVFLPIHPKWHPRYFGYLAESGCRAGLGCRSAFARLLGSRVPPGWGWGQGHLSPVSVVCCQVEVSASDWLFVHRSSTKCGVSEWSWSLDTEVALVHWGLVCHRINKSHTHTHTHTHTIPLRSTCWSTTSILKPLAKVPVISKCRARK